MLIGRTLARSATRWPDAEAVVEGDNRLTYREWNTTANRLVAGLQDLGLGADSRIAMFTYNGIEQVTTYLAAAKLGAIAVPLNHRLAAGEVAYLVNAAEAEILLYDPALTEVVAAARDNLDTIRAFIGTTEPPFGRPFTGLLDRAPVDPPIDHDPDRTSVMMHTSGTTGRPKLVELTPRGQWINSLSCAVELQYSTDDRALNIAPLYHSAGYLNLFLPILHVGGTNIIQRRFDPAIALATIEREGITTSLGVPTQYHRFRESGVDRNVESMRLASVSGAPFGRDLAEWVKTNLCARFINVYGLTESTGFVTILKPEELDRMTDGFCIGTPFLNMDVRAIEIGDGIPPDATVPAGERGQLITRSDKLMRGYYDQPAATAEALREGWLYTGDVVVQRDGFYYLVDRVDNMIISGGENVYPAEIERILNSHPRIKKSAVVGEDDPDLGERIVAYVVPADQSVTAADIETYWRECDEAADFKRPREIEFVRDIPTNPSGKIVRQELTR